jgi:2-polyprenyl-3-methyl-5-hydroxy-6-metoxy-1,4-benzoquinol methylase
MPGKVIPIDTRTAYDIWHLDLREEGEPTPTAPWHELAKKHLGPVRGLKVLEIGCGLGAFSKYLADLGADLTAADFSPAAVRLTAELLHERAPAVVADLQHLPFADESFDLVVSLDTLEHVPDPNKGLAELVRVTRPRGRLIITTPNYLSLVGLYRSAMHLTGRTYTELGQPINQPLTLVGRVRKLRRLGCRIDAVDGAMHVLPIPRYRCVELRFLEHPHALTKWFALHSLTAATRRPARTPLARPGLGHHGT